MPNLTVISSYPEKNQIHGSKTVGGASYSKNTLLSMKKQDPELGITVLAEKFNGIEEYVDDGNITVKRVWDRHSIGSLNSLIKEVKELGTKDVLVEFEMFMFGGFFHVAYFMLVLSILKLSNFNLYIVLHQVVGEVSVFESNKLKSLFYKAFKKLFYSYFVFLSNKTIVFEKYLKDNISSSKKVVVIPHAVEDVELIDSEIAKEELGLDKGQKYLLYFGYISPYKGVDLLVENFPEDSDYKLIIAGGPNPNHKNDEKYMKYVNGVLDSAKNKNIVVTGFVQEEDIKKYYSAADIIIFPYRTLMSSSGPISLAFSHEKPIMLSGPLENYFRSEDLGKILEEMKLTSTEFTFSNDSKSIKDHINHINNNYTEFKEYSKQVKLVRSWEEIAKCYLKEIQ